MVKRSLCEDDINANYELPSDQPGKQREDHVTQQFQELYTPGKRLQELACIVICVVQIAVNGALICMHLRLDRLSTVFISALFGMLVADFGSGLVHWILDTWGTADDFPVVGKHILRRFRLHHIDPTSITRHDFLETNGDNFAVGIPFLAYLTWFLRSRDPQQIQDNLAWICSIYLFSVLVALTNQIHKWSHTYFGLPNTVILLQKYHVILPRLHHRQHHVSPHETYYCITTGWLNWPLEKIHFWSALEKCIEKLTGAKPRSDDMLWAQKSS